jgi:hypothetical protein
MKTPLGGGHIGVVTGRRVLATVRWLFESLIPLTAGAARFLFASWRGFIVGMVVIAVLVLLDEIPGPRGTPAIDQLPVPALTAITVLELFIIAACWRLASGFRSPARRLGWARFLSTWAGGGLAFAVVALVIWRLASMGWYPAGNAEIIPAPAVAVGLLAAGAVNNRAALGKALASERSRSTTRLTQDRILAMLAKRPLAVPEDAAYSSWYAWSVCALPGGPATAHRAVQAAVAALRSGATARAAADAAARSRWSPAAVIERARMSSRSPDERFQL